MALLLKMVGYIWMKQSLVPNILYMNIHIFGMLLFREVTLNYGRGVYSLCIEELLPFGIVLLMMKTMVSVGVLGVFPNPWARAYCPCTLFLRGGCPLKTWHSVSGDWHIPWQRTPADDVYWLLQVCCALQDS